MRKTKILLLGANGYLGARLFFDLKDKFVVVGTFNKNQFHDDFTQLDITHKKQVRDVFANEKPDVVIQTANYPSPRHAINNEAAYRELNLKSTEYIVDAANQAGAKVIFISSFAALNPDNIYGELKLQSEEIVKKTKAGYLILRPSLILGLSPNTKNDRPFNRVLRCIDGKEQAKFDSSWKFQPTYVGHIWAVIERAINENIFNRLVHVFCSSIETQYSTAKDILKPFSITVTPVDGKLSLPTQVRDENELLELGLPTCSYQEMIERIHVEMQNPDRFNLNP